MRILADENFPGDTVTVLRQRGYDVLWVRTDAPGSSDQEVLERAQVEDRIVVTFDKDFGELAFRYGLPASSGIILLRLAPLSPAYVNRITVTGLESRSDWAGHFTVIEGTRIRMRPLPSLEGEES